MPCFHPIRGWRGRGGKIVTAPRDAVSPGIIRVGCGQCSHCRKMKSLAWSTRVMCEASMHAESSFVTLTYSEDPIGLYKEHVQLFFKRFRERLAPTKIRHFTVGEYGDKNHRAHWHSIVFGWYPDSSDLYETKRGHFSSHTLHDAWSLGYTDVGTCTPASAAYVAKYVQKKLTGVVGWNMYAHPVTGEILPERMLCSNRPGIGSTWFSKYMKEVFPDDELYFGGKLVRPPKYFFEKLKEVNPSLAEEVSLSRVGEFDEEEFCRLVLDGVAERYARSKDRANDTRHKEL